MIPTEKKLKWFGQLLKKKTQLSNNKIIELFNVRIIGLEPTRLYT
jgi:hypothetical protein